MDQMKTQIHERDETNIKRARNDIAAIQSLLPGLGHIYKGYYFQGIVLMILAPLFLWSGMILALATVGFGLLIPISYWALVTYHAYHVIDHRRHHIGVL